ncbi:hypothetical protein ACYOEI_13100 [Singulisphaera rosea]
MIELPPGVGIVEFLQHAGKPSSGSTGVPAEVRALTLAEFRNRYLTTSRDSLEDRTIQGIELHFRLVSLGG